METQSHQAGAAQGSAGRHRPKPRAKPKADTRRDARTCTRSTGADKLDRKDNLLHDYPQNRLALRLRHYRTGPGHGHLAGCLFDVAAL